MGAQRTNKDKNKVISKFAAFFKSNRVKPNTMSSYARTPDRGTHNFMDAPASGGKGGLLGFFRRGSSSKNLTAYLDEEARASSPNVARSASRPLLAPSGSEREGSEEVVQKLYKELDRFKELNTKLEKENEKLKIQMEQKPSPNTEDKSQKSEASSEGGNDMGETKARMVDLQVQIQEAKDEIFRIGAELVSARERERQLEEYVNTIIAQQQQKAASSAGGRARSAVPPCVPFPNTPESHAWLESIRKGTYQDYWQTAAASQPVSVAAGNISLPPPPALTLSSNGKKRSEIPVPPPLPAGMMPAASAALSASASGALAQGRRGSAPGLLESAPHQKKRESVFATAGQPKPELKPLFWTALDQTRVQGTIFEKLVEKPVVKPDAMNAQLKTLVTRFARRAAKTTAKDANGQSATAAPVAQVQAPRLQIMDPKRKQQLGIGLSGSFRNVSLIELKKAIIALDAHVLTLDRVKMLLEMIPTPEEMTQLDGFRAGGLLDQTFFAGMSKEETFFVDMAAIPRLKQRLLCLLMEVSFESSLSQLVEDLDVFADAVATVRDSQRWKEFLTLCLETGNFLNEGNNGLGGAWGFSLKEGLKKFSEMKSCENNSRFSLMHWIAEVAAAHKPELFGMIDEFGPVSDASTRSVEELKSEVNSIKRQLDIVKTEVEKSKMESSESSTKFLNRMVPFLEKTLLVEYARLQAKIDDIEKNAQQLVLMHGESPQQTSCQQLFDIILEGITAFLKCNEENQAQRLSEQKAALQQQNSARKITAGEGENRGNAKRDQNNRIMKDTGVASGQAKFELEIAMAKRRKAPQ